ncbi:hypothetical protein, partial [Porphyromonas endodontalis]
VAGRDLHKVLAENTTRSKQHRCGDGLFVFSEIYYLHGWAARIDGVDAKLLRSDYLLHAPAVPASKHQIVLSFHFQSLKITKSISRGTSALLATILTAHPE